MRFELEDIEPCPFCERKIDSVIVSSSCRYLINGYEGVGPTYYTACVACLCGYRSKEFNADIDGDAIELAINAHNAVCKRPEAVDGAE